jgi:hypothetical protein
VPEFNDVAEVFLRAVERRRDNSIHPKIPHLRQRWQISASARQQSCRSKYKLRACSRQPIEAMIREQALSTWIAL